MSIVKKYSEDISSLLKQIAEEEPVMRKAAEIISRAYLNDRMIHVIGPGGHSNMAVEEILWRAGGLAFWNAILDPGTNQVPGCRFSA